MKATIKNILTAVRPRARRTTSAVQFAEYPLIEAPMLTGTRCFATTVLRGSDNAAITGHLLEIDLEQWKLTQQQPIPIDSNCTFWNARGGNRGGRGVVAFDNRLYVAVAGAILVYDAALKPVTRIEHPWMAGLHEIAVDAAGIWVTSTVHDLLMQLDHAGNVKRTWWGSEHAGLQ